MNPIYEIRMRDGLTQSELAQRINTHSPKLIKGIVRKKDISRWENYHHRPGRTIATYLAELYGTTYNEFRSLLDQHKI